MKKFIITQAQVDELNKYLGNVAYSVASPIIQYIAALEELQQPEMSSAKRSIESLERLKQDLQEHHGESDELVDVDCEFDNNEGCCAADCEAVHEDYDTPQSESDEVVNEVEEDSSK